jgi:hypothetical protein
MQITQVDYYNTHHHHYRIAEIRYGSFAAWETWFSGAVISHKGG